MLYSDLTNEAIMFTDLVVFIPLGYYLFTKLTGGIVRAVAGEADNDFLENTVCILIGLVAIYGVMVLGSFNAARSLPRILLKDMPESSAVFSRWQERTKNSAVNVVVVDGETGQEIKINLLNISEEMGLLHGGEPVVYASLKDQDLYFGYLLDYQDLTTGRWIHLGYPYTADQVACSYQELMVMTLALHLLFLLWQHLRLRADLGHFPLALWWPTLVLALVQGAATAGAILLVWKFPDGTVPVPLLMGMVMSTTLLQPVCWLRVACLQIRRTAGVIPLGEMFAAVKKAI